MRKEWGDCFCYLVKDHFYASLTTILKRKKTSADVPPVVPSNASSEKISADLPMTAAAASIHMFPCNKTDDKTGTNKQHSISISSMSVFVCVCVCWFVNFVNDSPNSHVEITKWTIFWTCKYDEFILSVYYKRIFT